MNSGTVVPEIEPLGEDAFHNKLVAGFARTIGFVGKERFALALGMSKRGLEKVLAGGTPRAAAIFNIRTKYESALDELLDAYGWRIVPRDAVASTDSYAGLALLKAATACVEAEADGVTDHVELLAMEPHLRAARGHLDAMLARIDALRGAR